MRILAIGIATLDIINTVDSYPREDDEVRVRSQRMVRGGNATNTLVVLSQLGHTCYWGGVLSDDGDSRYVRDDLTSHHIGLASCEHYAGGKTPTSYVTMSADSGSRTIVHYRDLPEFSAAAFASIDLRDYDWVHFEGRNTADLAQMLERTVSSGTPCSLEIEKPREGIEALLHLPQLILFSKAYAEHKGYFDPEPFLHAMHQLASSKAKLFCAWGAEGAAAMDASGRFQRMPAVAPVRVVDTLGAGDVFNAAVIDAVLRDYDTGKILQHACALAGKKCGQLGLNGLAGKADG